MSLRAMSTRDQVRASPGVDQPRSLLLCAKSRSVAFTRKQKSWVLAMPNTSHGPVTRIVRWCVLQAPCQELSE
jgi:hypothetical protein